MPTIGSEKLLPRVVSVEAYPDFHLLLTFNNGETRLYDVQPLFESPVFRNLKKVFFQARALYGTVVWPGDIDISPDALYLDSKPVT